MIDGASRLVSGLYGRTVDEAVGAGEGEGGRKRERENDLEDWDEEDEVRGGVEWMVGTCNCKCTQHHPHCHPHCHPRSPSAHPHPPLSPQLPSRAKRGRMDEEGEDAAMYRQLQMKDREGGRDVKRVIR